MIAAVNRFRPVEAVSGSVNSARCSTTAAAAGIPIDPTLIISTDWGGEQGAEATAQLLARTDPPTAIYAHSDEVALGAMRTIRRLGLRIPQDISVIGIDDHPLASLTDLTTIRQPVQAQGTAAANMLLALLRNDDTINRAVTLPTQLIVRQTTAPPATRSAQL